MLAELIIKLQPGEMNVGFWQASVFQGFLMERIDRNYADLLHKDGWKPYSQYVEKEGDTALWHICTLNEEAYKQIILPFMDDDFKSVYLKQKEKELIVLDKQVRKKPKSELLEYMYAKEVEKTITLQFITPTAFKSNGIYQILPDVRMVFQSLMNKYSAASKTLDMFDTETLEALCVSSHISGYRLRSMFFPLEGVRIPSFGGEMTIRMGGKGTLAGYAQLLTEFGTYSGIGIKTAMGMGAVRKIRKGE